jgi:hypothetical protein
VGSYYTTADDKKFCDRFIEENRAWLGYNTAAARDRKWVWKGENVVVATMQLLLIDAVVRYQVGGKVRKKVNTLDGARALLDYIKHQVSFVGLNVDQAAAERFLLRARRQSVDGMANKALR